MFSDNFLISSGVRLGVLFSETVRVVLLLTEVMGGAGVVVARPRGCLVLTDLVGGAAKVAGTEVANFVEIEGGRIIFRISSMALAAIVDTSEVELGSWIR